MKHRNVHTLRVARGRLPARPLNYTWKPQLTIESRGLPLGYLNQLEHRLAETESALYAALMTLRSSRPALVVEAKAKPDSAQKQKAARMEEWTQLPLQNWSDMEHWRIAMSDHFLIEQSQEAPFTESSGLEYSMPVSSQITSDTPQDDMHTKISSGIYAWQPRDVQMGSSYGTDLRPPGMVSSPVYSRGHTAVEPEAVTSPTEGSSEYADITRAIEGHSRGTAQSTMADELSKSHPSIYF